jgi:MYXO-CTERM domain-containing protein
VPFRCLAVLWAIAAWARPVMAEPHEVASETPYPGVTYTTWTDDALPANLYSIELDLTSNEIDLVATAEDQKGVKPSAFAAAVGAKVVINGDYFKPAGFAPAGIARGSTETWSNAHDTDRSGFIRFHRGVTRIEADISPPDELVEELSEEVVGAVGGRPLLMRAGAVESSFDCEDLQAMPCDAAPRTAVALSGDRSTMWLVVVDGWQSGSIGMTASEVAAFAKQLGAADALMLDGGSASALWLTDAVVSKPSDGVERPVANHIAVKTGVPANGLLLGHVFEKEIDGPRIAGALVTLDDGFSKTYDGTNVWRFEVRPRWACVTATADGYHEATQCRHVPEDAEKYASITMIPSSEYIDAGPGGGDAGADAGTTPAADGGPDGDGKGGCGCRHAGEPAPGAGLFLAVLIVLRQRARRGTERVMR